MSAKAEKKIDNQQEQMVYDVSKKDVQGFIESTTQLELYGKYRDMCERNILIRMNANRLTKLGGEIEIVQEHYFDSIEVKELLGLFLNDELAKSIVVTVDIPMTEKHLREKYGMTDVAIKPLIDILKKRLSAQRDVLKIIKKGK